MFGGIAVGGNLLCVAHSDVRGRVILVDLDERRVVSYWEYGPESGGWLVRVEGLAVYAA